jgi:hypothetical protein
LYEGQTTQVEFAHCLLVYKAEPMPRTASCTALAISLRYLALALAMVLHLDQLITLHHHLRLLTIEGLGHVAIIPQVPVVVLADIRALFPTSCAVGAPFRLPDR